MIDTETGRWTRRVELLILAVGVGVRLARFLEPRTLWYDEALISLNVLSRSPLALLRPLEGQQFSSLGFLWGEWFVTRVGGAGEHALRFLPLIASIISLVLFARLARRLLEPAPALLALTLAALSAPLVYYSAEVKSYGFDWLCALLLMNATLDLVSSASRRAWLRWSVLAAFTALMCTPAPFIVAGCAVALVAHGRVEPRALTRIAAAVAPAVAIHAFQLLTTYRSSETTAFMQLYWGGGETFLEPNIQGGLVRSGRIALDYWVAVLLHPEFLDVLPPAVVLVIMSISLVGAVTIARRSSVAAVMLFTPAILAALASFAKLWPLHPRLLLFAAPAVLITVASGVFTLADRAPRPMKALLHVVPSSLLLVGTAAALFLEWAANPRVAALPDALRELPARVGTSATVYLSFDLEPLCTYYLGWHPDRSELPGDPSQRHCAIPGVDIIIGNGPEYEGIAPGAAGGRGRRVRPEWLEKETQQILTGAPAEVWLFVGYVTELHRDLPNWFEAHGVGPGERHDRRAIVVRRYTPPSDSNVQLGRSVD